MPEFQCLCEIYGFAFTPRLKSWAFCLNDRKSRYMVIWPAVQNSAGMRTIKSSRSVTTNVCQ